jgi:ABC-type branched-subunit amino acid transport system substrate-binding protein
VRARLVASCVLGLLLFAACGSRLPDEVLESIDNASARGVVAGPALQSSDDADTTDAGTGSTSDGATSAGSGSTRSGTSPGSTGGGPAPAVTKSNAACEKARSAAPGVTDDEIKVASIVTDSGPLPGATEGSFRGAASYFAMINASGGVCGRKITIAKGDDGLDPAKGRADFLRLEPGIFAFVGSFAVADSGYIDLIRSSKVPYVSLVVEPAGRDARNVMPKAAGDRVSTAPFVWWKRQHPTAKRAAMLFADVGGVSANVPGFSAAIKKAGFDLRYTDPADVTSPDFTPEVQKAIDNDIDFLYLFAFEVNMQVRMVRSMRQQGYDPEIKGANIAFNTRFSELLGSDGDGWENHNTHLLFLDPKERTRSEDLARFVDWNDRVFPGAQLDLFPVSGWGRAALFVEALQKISGAITREALVNALYQVDAFNGGGVETTIDPVLGYGKPCFNMAVHKGGHWQREFPTTQLYECGLGSVFKFK